MKKILIFLFVFSCLFSENQRVEREIFKKTSHSMTINGKEINYTAVCGTFLVKSKDEKSSAEIFYVSYSKDNSDVKNRPVTFVFNGGPGSSSVWLHMGAFGPKKVLSFEETQNTIPPYFLIDNEECLLDFTDLVFIDLVGTGFSSVIEGNADVFYGKVEDAKATGDFIYQYILNFNRWMSPKYLIGESYGTMRAIWATEYLQDYCSIFLSGIYLISPVLDYNFAHSPFSNENYALILSSFAASAWYHHRLPEDLQEKSLNELICDVENFALNEYLLALMQGELLQNEQRERIVLKLAAFTGLSKECIEKNNLRIDEETFALELLPREKATSMYSIVGVHDARVKGYQSKYFWENPSLEFLAGSYTAVVNDYLRNELECTEDAPYVMFNKKANCTWKWREGLNLNFVDIIKTDLSYDIKHILSTNPNIKILLACGYFDLVTPYNFNKFTVEQLHLPVALRKNIKLNYYEAGHMPYLNKEAHKQMKEDFYEFFKRESK